MVMIEAMACGTPVIAFRRGSVAEVIEEGVSGMVVENVDQAVDAAKRVCTLERERVRRCFDQHFTATRMAQDYVGIYRGLVASSSGGFAADPSATSRRAA